MRTWSASPIDPDNPNSPTDLDLFVVDGLESLRQRILQRFHFPLGSWQLDTREGTEPIVGTRNSAALSTVIITDTIRNEGGDEVTGVEDVEFSLNHDTRVYNYSATVHSIYGTLTVGGTTLL